MKIKPLFQAAFLLRRVLKVLNRIAAALEEHNRLFEDVTTPSTREREELDKAWQEVRAEEPATPDVSQSTNQDSWQHEQADEKAKRYW